MTGHLTYRELIIYIRQLPMDSALGRAFMGDAAEWTIAAHLLGDVVDLLNIANWQRSGSKKRAPKPIKRPKPPAEITAGQAGHGETSSVGPPSLRDRLNNTQIESEVSDADDDPKPRC